jgi:hypothetical protein
MGARLGVFRQRCSRRVPFIADRSAYEPNRLSLCVQGIFQASSGFANPLSGYSYFKDLKVFK